MKLKNFNESGLKLEFCKSYVARKVFTLVSSNFLSSMKLCQTGYFRIAQKVLSMQNVLRLPIFNLANIFFPIASSVCIWRLSYSWRQFLPTHFDRISLCSETFELVSKLKWTFSQNTSTKDSTKHTVLMNVKTNWYPVKTIALKSHQMEIASSELQVQGRKII